MPTNLENKPYLWPKEKTTAISKSSFFISKNNFRKLFIPLNLFFLKIFLNLPLIKQKSYL